MGKEVQKFYKHHLNPGLSRVGIGISQSESDRWITFLFKIEK